MNPGKQFEKDIKDSAHSQGVWILRLNDTSLSWEKEKAAKFTPTNICDFLVFSRPNLFAIECKSSTYKSISIQRDAESPTAMIRSTQISDLANLSTVEGLYAGFMLNFRNDRNIDENVTCWISIQNFTKFLVETNKQSINKEDCIKYGAVVIEQRKKRVHFWYDLDGWISKISRNPEPTWINREIVKYAEDQEDIAIHEQQ